MPNGENGSQTGIEDISGDLKNILKSARVDLVGNVSDSPDEISRDVAYIEQLQQMFPDFQGRNVYNVKYQLMNNEDGALDKVTTRLLTIRAQNEPALQEKIQDPKMYKKAYNNIQSHVKKNILSGSVTGESIANTIVDRKLKLFKSPTKDEQPSVSYRNNNPLNMMIDMSDELKASLAEKGIQFEPGDTTNEDGTIARFQSYEDGMKAAKTAIMERHADSTVTEMLETWSNKGYSGNIIDEELANKKVKDLAPAQLDKLVRRMQKQEGWNEGDAAKRAVPVESFKKYIKENPERYSEYGIVDSEGNTIFDNLDDENRSLEAMVQSNDELHRKLLEDRYRDFEEVLDNQNNMPNELAGVPGFQAQAFAIYDKYGSEGLTNFINIIQQDELKESSPAALRKAVEWYRNNDVGRTRQRFMGQGSDRISFIPPKATLDLVAKVPADANEYGAFKYKFNKEKKEFELKDDETIINELIERYTEVPITDLVEIGTFHTGGVASNPSKTIGALFNYVANLDYFTESEEEYIKGFKEDLRDPEKSGMFLDNGYTTLVTNIIDKHRKDGNVNELIRTLQANGQPAGEGKWIIDYENVDLVTKAAIDALNQSMDYSSFIYPMQDVNNELTSGGKVVLDLNRRERIAGEVNRFAMESAERVGAWEWKKDEENNRWVKEFDSGIYDDTFNMLETLNFGALQMLDKHFIGPTMQNMASFFRTVQNTTGWDTADDIAKFLDFQSESDLVEGVNSVQIAETFSTDLGSDLAFVDNGSFLTKTLAKATPMGQVIGSIVLKGKGALGGASWATAKGARFIDRVTKTGKAMSKLGAAKYLKGNKFSTIMDRWDQAQKANKFWTYGGTFYLGDAVEEMSMPKNMTMMNFGTRLVDDAMEKYLNMETDYNQDYRAANGIVRTGLDLLASFGISSVFDNLLVAPARWGKDWGAIWLNRRVPTLDVNAEGQVVKANLDSPMWRNDMTEFMHNITKDVDDWAMSNTESAILGDMLAGVKKPQDDLTHNVRNTIKDMNSVIDDNLKDTIRQSVRYWQKKMGNKLSPEDISKITEERYDEFLEKMADGIFNMFNKANRNVPEQVPLKIANILENGSLRISKVTDDAGNELHSLENAQRYASGDIGKIIKRIRDDRYVVKNVKENSWAVELGTKIRKRGKDQGINPILREEESILDRSLQEAEEEKLRAIWSYLYGRKLGTDQGDVYITGLSKFKGFKAINDAGEELDSVLLKDSEGLPKDVAEYVEKRAVPTEEPKAKPKAEEPEPEPEPINLAGQFEVGDVTFSSAEGALGRVGNNAEADVKGFGVKMTIEEFLDLAPPRRGREESEPIIKEAFEEGQEIGTPFFMAKWDEEAGAWRIENHEGRGRLQQLKAQQGADTEVPVHIFTDVKPQNITDEMASAPILGQEGSTKQIFNTPVEPKSVVVNNRLVKGDDFFGAGKKAKKAKEAVEATVKETEEAVEEGGEKRLKNLIENSAKTEVIQKARQNAENYIKVLRELVNQEDTELGYKGSFGEGSSRNTYGFTEENQKFLASLRDSGRKALSMIEKAVRNLGVDDLRMIDLVRETKSGALKRILGKKNRAPVTYWNPEKIGDGIPRGVLVKKKTSDGLTLHYLTNKKTTLEPSKWVRTDEGLRLNPDWDMVHINHTFDDDGNFQFYVRELVDGEPMYRKARPEDENSVLLNIQNPLRTDEEIAQYREALVNYEELQRTMKLSEEDIVRREIDGYIRRIDGEDYYQPIKENDQVIDPDAVLEENKRSAVFGKKSGVKNKKEAILQNVEQAGFATGTVGRVAAYAIAGEIADNIFSEDDLYGAEWGAAFALLTGLKPVRNAIKGVMYGTSEKSYDMFDHMYKWAERLEPDEQEKEWLNVWDPAGDTRKKEYKEWYSSLVTGIKNAAETGRDVSEAISKNRFVQSTFSMLEEIKEIPGVNRLKKMLLNVDHTPNELKSKLSTKFGDRFQREIDRLPNDHPRKEELQQLADGNPFEGRREQMISFVDRFIDEKELDGVKIGNQVVRTDRMSDSQKINYFNEQFWRVMNTGARFTDDGRYVRGATRNTQHIYEGASNPRMLEELDQRFLNDPYWGTFTNSMREWFGEIKTEWLQRLSTNMIETKHLVKPKHADIANRLIKTQDSLRDFRLSLNDADSKLYSEALGKNKDHIFDRLVKLKRVRDRFEDMGETYLPQIWSSRKFQQEQERYITDYLRNTEDATRKEAKNSFLQKVMKDWMNLNNGKPRKLQEYTIDDGEVKVKKYTSYEKARSELRELITHRDTPFTQQQQADLLRDETMDRFIKEVKEEVVSPNTQELNERTRWIIDEPEEIRRQYGGSVVDSQNKQAYEHFFDLISTGGLVKSSNYLENPRNFVLPNYLAEDNFETIFYKYSEDVGRKLHFARENVFVEDDMSREFLNKIGNGLEKHFKDVEHPRRVREKYISRIKDVYRQQAGIAAELKLHKNADERAAFMRKKIRTSQLVGTIRNIIGSGYVWGIAWYDIFQHAIMSPILTSWGSWNKARKVMANTDAANRMNDLGMSLQYSNQKIHTFLPEIDEFTYADTDSYLGKAYGLSKGMLDWSGDFSFTRKLGEKTGWFNVDDWGQYRLLADGFYGVNQTATSINALAHLSEAEELAKIWQQIKANGGDAVRKGLKTYTEGDVRRGFETLGIFGEEIDDFVAKNGQINQLIDHINGKENRQLKLEDLNTDQYKYIRRILETATDSYHGRNKMFRPETWNTQMGRLVGQYSFYPMNFSLQTLQRRIRQPISQWNQQYSHLIDGEKLPAWKILTSMHGGQKGIDKLKSAMKGTDEEIEAALRDFPVDAYTTVLKLLPATGLTFAMTLTTDAVDDLVALVYNEALGMAGMENEDMEYFKRTRENFVMNPYVRGEKHKRSLYDIIDDPEWNDITKVLAWMMSYTADMGTFGKYGNAVFRNSRFEDSGVLDLSPVGREVENLYDVTLGTIGKAQQEGIGTVPGNLGKGLYNFIAPKIPVYGSQSLLRNKVEESIFSKPKRQGKGQVFFESEDVFGNEQVFGTEGVTFE